MLPCLAFSVGSGIRILVLMLVWQHFMEQAIPPASGITHLRVSSSCLQSFHLKCLENLVCWFKPGNLSTREKEAVQCYPQPHTEASLDYTKKRKSTLSMWSWALEA